MELEEYFKDNKGLTVLSTADDQGNVDTAIYSPPRFFDDGRIGFIMRENLSYANIQKNPNACVLFLEHTEGYKGKRLYLKKAAEDDNPELINEHLKRCSHPVKEAKRHMVYFELTKERPLVGG
jgi:hypothetical protein